MKRKDWELTKTTQNQRQRISTTMKRGSIVMMKDTDGQDRPDTSPYLSLGTHHWWSLLSHGTQDPAIPPWKYPGCRRVIPPPEWPLSSRNKCQTPEMACRYGSEEGRVWWKCAHMDLDIYVAVLSGLVVEYNGRAMTTGFDGQLTLQRTSDPFRIVIYWSNAGLRVLKRNGTDFKLQLSRIAGGRSQLSITYRSGVPYTVGAYRKNLRKWVLGGLRWQWDQRSRKWMGRGDKDMDFERTKMAHLNYIMLQEMLETALWFPSYVPAIYWAHWSTQTINMICRPTNILYYRHLQKHRNHV